MTIRAKMGLVWLLASMSAGLCGAIALERKICGLGGYEESVLDGPDEEGAICEEEGHDYALDACFILEDEPPRIVGHEHARCSFS